MSRSRRNRWGETRIQLVEARKFAERCGFATARPENYIAPLGDKDREEWDSLLDRMQQGG